MVRDSSSTSHSEKDIEAGYTHTGSVDDIARQRDSDVDSEYDEAIVRVTTAEVDDETKQEHHTALRTVSTTRTAKDIEAVLNTEFEVRWTEGDPDCPLNWSMLYRGFILVTVAMQTLVVIFASTSFISGSPGMVKELDVSSQTLILGMTTYLFGLAFGPLLLAPMSELYGRRVVYLISFSLYFIFVIPLCVAKNFTTIAVMRFFGAFVGSVTISNAPGTLGDCFPEEWLTTVFSIFCLAPMNGPVIGPIVGGFVYQNLGWRWNNWLVLILAGAFGILTLAIPETYAPVLLRRRAEKKRQETGNERYCSRFCHKDGDGDIVDLIKLNMKRPILMLFTEPICIFWAVYIAAVYGILYLCFTAYPIVFSEIREWGPGISGLAFVGIGVGTVLAVLTEPLSRKVYNMHAIDPETGKRPPEARILLVCVAAFLIPVSMLWFAWTCVPARIHWILPILSGVPYGLGNTYVFLHSNNYLVVSYDIYAASAMAGNTVARSILGGVMPLFGPLMYRRLGPNWAATTVALIAFALAPIPLAFYKWGHIIRKKSPMLQRLQQEKRDRGG